jgi:anti-anti-sigma regulatory factor
MAAKPKKRKPQPQTIEDNQDTIKEDLLMAAETEITEIDEIQQAEQSLMGAEEAESADDVDDVQRMIDELLQSETASGEEDVAGQDGMAEDTDTDAPEEESPESLIVLEPTLSIQNVVKLYDKLKKSYAAFDHLEIDASRVTAVDTATLQVFAALKKDAVKQNKTVDFMQPSPRFIESAQLLGLLDLLDISSDQ